MQAKDAVSFREGISGVMGFYEKTLAPFAFDAWWNALKIYELNAVIDAFNRHLANPDAGQYPPKPADIRRMLEGSTQDAALRAWAKVDKGIREVGTYEDVVFDDALIHRVIQDMGGWIGLGTKTEDEWPFIAKEFENRYRGFKAKNEPFEYPWKLLGLTNAHNERNGFKAEEPILIGDETKALAVLNNGTDKPAIGFKRLSDVAEKPVQLRRIV